MNTYTLHVTIRAKDDADALAVGAALVDLLDPRVGTDDWDVSGTDDTGAQDWSVIVPREVTA